MKKTVKIDQSTWERLMELRLKLEKGQRVTMDDVIRRLLDIERFEILCRNGWHFAIWLQLGSCIIQGSPSDGDDDWAFDVQSKSLHGAIIKALHEARRLEG